MTAPDTPGHPPTASTTGGVAEALAAHDVELGLGRGGPILSAAESAARSGDAPLEGSATFDVAVHADGGVVARLLTSEGSADAWSRVASALGRSVDPRHVRLPPGGRGWHAVVRVEARVKLVDGRDVRSLHGPRVSVAHGVLANALEGKPDARGSSTGSGGPDHVSEGPTDAPPVGGALGRGPAHPEAAAAQGLAQRLLPAPTLSVSGKICSAALSVSPVGVSIAGGCSPENVGTHAARVVSGRIVSEGSL